MTTPGFKALPTTFAALLLLSAVAGGQQPPPNEQGSVAEEITVSETSLLVELAGRLTPRQAQRLRTDQVRLSEGGVPREVLRLTPVIGGPEDRWHFLLYIDATLSRPETVRQAALAVAEQVPTIVRLGELRVVLVEEGTPRELQAATRNVTRLTDLLAELGKRPPGRDLISGLRQRYTASLARGEPSLADRQAALAREVELVRRQGDHLLRLTGAGCPADACALLLVSDGFYVNPEVYYLSQAWSSAHPQSGIQAEQTTAELAETLAATEWISIVMPLERPEPEADDPIGAPETGFDRMTQIWGTHFDGISIRRRRSRLDTLPAQDFQFYLEPLLQPMRMLAEETSGGILRSPTQLAGELDKLAGRWRLWYATTRPLDGQVRPVEASLTHDNKRLRAPLWVDASTPAGIAAARVRGILDDAIAHGELPLRALAATRGDRRFFRLEAEWGPDSPSQSSGKRVPLRASFAYRPPGEPVVVVHQVFDTAADPAAATRSYELEAPIPKDAGTLAITLEDLRFRVWGSTLLEISR